MQTSAKRSVFAGLPVGRIGLLAVIAVFMLCMTTITGNAQSSAGAILGTITDQSGAVLPDTVVQLVNQATGTKDEATSNASGYYQFPVVQPGTYKMVIQKQGFKTMSRPGIVLQNQSRIQVDLSLTVGASTETVEVTASSPLIQADNVSLGTVIDERQTNELPLNGRNPMNLTALVASVIPLGQTQGSPTGVNPIAWGNYQIGGGMAGQNNVFLDGAPDWGIYDHNIEIIPTQDSIAEFKVETNNLSAEYGRLAGGAIQFTTKSGSKDLHGSAWEFIRNKIFNANTWFANNGGASRPAFTQNQYGFNVGGPIWLGHLYDGRKRTFFFFNWEGYNQRVGQTYTTTVPDAQFLTGDASAWAATASNPAIYDPLTTCTNAAGCAAGTFTNNGFNSTALGYGQRMPIGWDQPSSGAGAYTPYHFQTAQGFSNSINPTSMAYLKYVFPNPTDTTKLIGNYTYNASGGGNNYQAVVKLDHDLTERNHLSARYTHWHNESLPVDVFAPKKSGICGNGACGETYFVHNGVLADTATLSSKTILDVRLSFARFVYNRTPVNTGFDVTQIGWPSAYQSLVEFPGPASFSVPSFDPGTYSLFGGQGSDSTIIEAEDSYRLAGTLTRFWGNHTVKVGGEYAYNLFNYAQSNTAAGLWYWNSNWTSSQATGAASGGLDVASYLLGYPSSGGTQYAARIASKQIYPAIFVTDDWRASSKLTFHVGIRWENNLPFTERHNWLSSFDPTQPNAVVTAAGSQLPGVTAPMGNVNLVNTPGRTSSRVMDTFGKQFSPRAGMSYRFAPNTVINVGYGIFWLPNDVTLAQNPGWDGDGASPTTTKTTVDGVSPIGCTNPTGLTSIGTVRTCNISYPFPMTNPNDATTSYIVLPSFRTQTNGTTNLPTPLVNYQGNAIALPSAVYKYQLNTLGAGPTEVFPKNPYAYTQQWNAGVQQQIGKSLAVAVSYAGAKGTHLPFGWLGMNNTPDSYLAACGTINGVNGCGGSFSSAALSNQVPNPYAAVIPSANGNARATVDQGQMWRKWNAYGGISEPANLGDSFYNALEVKITKRFSQGASINVAYTFAKFSSNTDTLNSWLESVTGQQDSDNLKGEMSLSSSDAPQRLVVAYVYDIPVGRGKAVLPNIGRVADLAIGGWGLQGMTTLMKGFPLGIGMNGGRVYSHGQRPSVLPGCNKKTSGSAVQRLNNWFNTACFTDPGVNVYGNEPRNDPSLEAPGMANWDLSIVKKFPITADGRLNLQFRAEFYNLFNRTQFGVPSTGISGYNLNSDGSQTPVNVNSNIGRIFNQLNNPRIAQFALRVNF
jgi:hypothetical protein